MIKIEIIELYIKDLESQVGESAMRNYRISTLKDELNKALNSSDITISISRVNNYARHQFNRGSMNLDLIKFEDWIKI